MSQIGQSVRYRRFKDTKPRDDGWTDAQFTKAPKKIPYKAIMYAFFLFVAGGLLMMLAGMMHSGYVEARQGVEKSYPLFIIGSLMFVPGSYHTLLAYQAWYKVPGWEFEDIPSIMDEE